MIDIELLLEALALISVLTGLVVEAIKKLKSDLSNNLIALIVSLVLSIALGAFYAIFNNLDINIQYGANVLILAFMSALCAELGFDKIKQMLLQLKEGEKD